MGAGRRPSTDRGQTSIDFLIGIGIFLLAVGFVFAATPGMIDPFTGDQEHPLVADRIADQLVDGMFVVPERPRMLNESCTFGFFNDSLGDGSGCVTEYDETVTDLQDRLELGLGYSVNVSLRRVNASGGAEMLYANATGTGVSTGPPAAWNNPTKLAIGPDPSGAQSTITVRRTSTLDGRDVRLVVFVW